MRTLSRMTIAGAAAVALLLAPAGIAASQAVASAPAHNQDSPAIALDSTQRAAVIAARAAYIGTASGIRATYRSTVAGLLEKVQTSTSAARLAYDKAKDAYVVTRVTGGTDAEVAAAKTALDNAQTALRTALDAAKSSIQSDLDAARNTARSALDTAKTDYVAAINKAVPNAPAWLLVPPGGGKSWISHGFSSDMSMGMGSHR